MFSLIIAIVSIALIVALVALGGYFGGDAVVDAQATTNAARLISEERQIFGSMDMFQADMKRWPTSLDELVSTGYLRSIPQGAKMAPSVAAIGFGMELISNAQAADTALAIGWGMPAANIPIIYTVQVPKGVCKAYNLAERGDNGILRQAFEVLPAQCYGADGDYRVVVRKTGANVTLGAVLDSAVETGNMPGKDNEDWWDTVPTGSVKQPIDPVKQPKAQLSLSGALPISFGEVQVGSSDSSGLVVVRNSGKVIADGVSVAVPDGFDLVNNNCGANLAVGSSCNFAVSFTPVAAKSYSGTLRVTATNGPAVQAAVSGVGVIGSAELAGLNFGDVAAGASLTGDATVRNTGTVAIRLGGAAVSGPGFVLTNGGTCGTTLVAGQACTYKVTLTAAGITSHVGRLVVDTAEVGQLNADLIGQSREARLTVSPATNDFGDVQQLTTALSPVLHTVSNTGNLDISGLVVPATVGKFSRQQTTCATSLAVGATCSFKVQFAPTDATLSNSTFTITGSNGGSAQLQATGQGTAPAGSLSAVAFGLRGLSSSTNLVSTLKNTGKGPLTVTAPTSASVANTSGSTFSFVSTTCPTTLAADATCDVVVRYAAPATVGTHTGTLTVNTSASAGALVAQLSGNSGSVVVTYAIGAAGPGMAGTGGGNAGGTTTVSVSGYTVTASGGLGGRFNDGVSVAGGSGSGSAGAQSSAGGSGAGAAGNLAAGGGGGGGGGVGSAPGGAASAARGGTGGSGVDVAGLKAAVVAAGMTWNTGGTGGSMTADLAHGGSASGGFGSGGGGAGGSGSFGGVGGPGGIGGGGGGAANWKVSSGSSGSGGAGGSGAVVILFTNATSVVLTSGNSYTVPNGKFVKTVWAVGGGGGGSGVGNVAATSGGGGGAGGVAYITLP